MDLVRVHPLELGDVVRGRQLRWADRQQRTIVDGETLLSPVATRALVDRFRATPTDDGGPQRGPLPTLTDRERELTGLAVHGLSNQGIGERLLLSPLTVLTHVHRAMAKLGARDRAQLVVIACQEGLVRAS